MIKIANLIIAICLLSFPALAQVTNPPFGWDLTYSSVLRANKIGSKTFIRKWLASEYQSPAKNWISKWKGDFIISSILIEYAAFSHAGEHSTMWLFRTQNHAYYWQEIEDTNGSEIKIEISPQIYDTFFAQLSPWKQAKPNQPLHPQSIPGYLGFLNIYEKNKSRQMLLSEEDFLICKTKKCDVIKAGRLMLALKPIISKLALDKD